ncbi:MAG TPA: hypothetical protein VHC69_25200 [Polyangiaceae bacterium]|nr:hypothetical protein [Polyangiaceae bacterium]
MNDVVSGSSSAASSGAVASLRGFFRGATRFVLLRRAQRTITALQRPVEPRDRAPRLLGWLAFLVYFAIGSKIERAGAFNGDNYFFNADCVRVVANVFRADQVFLSAVAGHPLIAILVSPLVAVLRLVLTGTGNLPERLLCHAAAAGAVALAYRVYRAFGASRALSTWGALVYGASCSELVLGSIIETFAFVSLTLTASVLVAERTDRVLGNALASVATFGVNAALVAHALFAPPLLWLGRMRFARWAPRVLLFVVLAVALALAVAKIQELVYPGVGFFFQKDAVTEYHPWWAIPDTRSAVSFRASRLVPHFFAYSIVAPSPLYSSDSAKMTTFMQADRLASYDVFGKAVVTQWIVLALIAAVNNVRSLFLGDGVERSRVVLLVGWLLGAFVLFMVFGDDLLLYSSLWTFHLVTWVVLGMRRFVGSGGAQKRWAISVGFAFAAALAANNAVFVVRMLAPY